MNLRALWTVLRGRKITFPTTPKERQTGNFFKLVWPQSMVFFLSLFALACAWTGYSTGMWGSYSFGGLVLNTFWIINNMMAMWGVMAAAFWTPPNTDEDQQAATNSEELKYEV